MTELVADCPRCGAERITLDVLASTLRGERYDWQKLFEVFCVCRRCHKGVIYFVAHSEYNARAVVRLWEFDGCLNDIVTVEDYISLKDEVARDPPEHLPKPIEAAFKEAATCHAVGTPNAAGTMFRLCIDLATRELLPAADAADGPNEKQRRDLGLRLPWLFDHGKLPEALRDLSACVHQDGNDGAHQGTLTKPDADDLLDFSVALLERLYTEPERIRQAKQRRDKRREPKA